MSHRERTGVRSLLYSGWHRERSIAQYIGIVSAAKLCMIDIDAVEYCYCGQPLALIETQESHGPPKPAPVMSALARMAGIPAYSVSVQVSEVAIAGFQVRQLVPVLGDVTPMLPQTYAYWLLSLRDSHSCATSEARPA